MLLHQFASISAQTGNWSIANGQLPNGKTYTGNVNITQAQSAYRLDWKTAAGNYSGVGLLVNGNLFAGYGLGDAGYGVVVYRASAKENTLEGLWTGSGMNGVTGIEYITGGNGQYQVSGQMPNGQSYSGTLSLQKTGDTFQAQWAIGNTIYNGVGMLSGDLLVIGYGYGQGFGVVEYAFNRNQANGRWAMGGGQSLGIENLQK